MPFGESLENKIMPSSEKPKENIEKERVVEEKIEPTEEVKTPKKDESTEVEGALKLEQIREELKKLQGASTTEKQPEEEKIKHLFGHCFEISKFEEGDRIPVGGESAFSPEADIKIEGDFKNFQEFFKETNELSAKYNLPELKKWLGSQGVEVDEKLFADLFAFTKKLEQKYPDNPDTTENRRKLYSEKGKELKLSDIFNKNSAECAEIAALAQGYLQQKGLPSSYFSGDVLRNRNEEFSEEHSFIVIRQGDKVFIYDPANPVNANSGKFPSLYATEANFDKEVSKGQKRFVTAKNFLSKKESFYGVNDGTNIVAEKHII